MGGASILGPVACDRAEGGLVLKFSVVVGLPFAFGAGKIAAGSRSIRLCMAGVEGMRRVRAAPLHCAGACSPHTKFMIFKRFLLQLCSRDHTAKTCHEVLSHERQSIPCVYPLLKMGLGIAQGREPLRPIQGAFPTAILALCRGFRFK